MAMPVYRVERAKHKLYLYSDAEWIKYPTDKELSVSYETKAIAITENNMF